jgi:Ca-activated chloride channel family protein
VVAPRYLGEPGRTPDAERITVGVNVDGEVEQAPHMGLVLLLRDALAEGRRPMSPSHGLSVNPDRDRTRVGFADAAGAALDRDIVVRWAVAAPRVGVGIDVGRPASDRAHANRAYGLLTIVPPTAAASFDPVARDLIVLIDTSGSMGGRPLEQARRVVAAMIDTLDERDRIELIEFSSRANRFRPEPLPANAKHRAAAQAWLARLTASGATQMHDGIYEALRPLRGDAQRQILLITDGLIGFEEQIVDTIQRDLPRGSRLHTLGVGSAVNQSLIGPAARAGRGTQAIVGLDEDVEPVAQRMVAATTAPLLVDVEVVGGPVRDTAPARLPDLYAGQPALVGVALDPAGGEVTVRGRTATGSWSETITVPAVEAGSAGVGGGPVTALYGREHVEDLEMQRASGHESRSLDAEIERIGLEFQISTRLTSWVAVSENQTVDPRDPSRRETMPQALPHGMSVEGLGLRGPAVPVAAGAPEMLMSRAMMAPPAAMAPPAPGAPRRQGFGSGKVRRRSAGPAAPPPPPKKKGGITDAIRGFFRGGADDEEAFEAPAGAAADGGSLVLRGKLVHRAGELAVFETSLDLGLAWEPPARVTVVEPDGTEHHVEVDVGKTTRAGRLVGGQILRIAVRLPSAITTIECIRLEVDGGFEILIDP